MIPEVKTVLCATDLSDYGVAPVPVACAIVADGGKIIMLHVEEDGAVPSPLYAHYSSEVIPTPEQREKMMEEVREKMRSMVPDWATARGIEVEAVIRNDKDPGHGIVTTADEFDVDIICVGTHGRGALAHLL
ncbi:MAG: universal stress protein, partial [Planctomycetota bacterium]